MTSYNAGKALRSIENGQSEIDYALMYIESLDKELTEANDTIKDKNQLIEDLCRQIEAFKSQFPQ